MNLPAGRKLSEADLRITLNRLRLFGHKGNILAEKKE